MSDQVVAEIRKLFVEGKTVRQIRLALSQLGIADLDEKSDQTILHTCITGKEAAK
jgi:hypothetical protein